MKKEGLFYQYKKKRAPSGEWGETGLSPCTIKRKKKIVGCSFSISRENSFYRGGGGTAFQPILERSSSFRRFFNLKGVSFLLLLGCKEKKGKGTENMEPSERAPREKKKGGKNETHRLFVRTTG